MKIETEEEYETNKRELEQLWDKAKPGTPEGERFEELAEALEVYEKKHFSITYENKPRCGDSSCRASTGICGRMTFGKGELDEFGYWQKPCRVCAEAYEKDTGEKAWPSAEGIEQ